MNCMFGYGIGQRGWSCRCSQEGEHTVIDEVFRRSRRIVEDMNEKEYIRDCELLRSLTRLRLLRTPPLRVVARFDA